MSNLFFLFILLPWSKVRLEYFWGSPEGVRRWDAGEGWSLRKGRLRFKAEGWWGSVRCSLPHLMGQQLVRLG